MIEELDAENTEAMMMKTSEELHYYISVCANIRLPMKEAGLPLDVLVAYGCNMMRWCLG
jgi:hypothetical protein